MQNKAQAYDLLAEAFQNPDLSLNYATHPILQTLPPEDASELGIRLQQVQQAKQLQFQFQSGQLEIAKKQMDLMYKNMENTFTSMMTLKDSLNEAMEQAKKGYSYVMVMYVVVFYSGIALIATAIVFAAFGKNIMAGAFGAIGLIDIVTYMLYKPPLELQTSRSNFAQLTAALISWFTDLMNLNTFLSLLPPPVSFADLEKVCDKQAVATEKLMKLIEEYSEPGKNK